VTRQGGKIWVHSSFGVTAVATEAITVPSLISPARLYSGIHKTIEAIACVRPQVRMKTTKAANIQTNGCRRLSLYQIDANIHEIARYDREIGK